MYAVLVRDGDELVLFGNSRYVHSFFADARAFDSFGAQRPGRAVYLELSAEL